ncbi:hypothetical protein Poli38472_000862 [Pythium oligandrum]|uniref:Uncharacterized protein n=1 Tax=Pythium oligandrum TaxID=41045 RepID=A0A8K1CCW7_PYTOL|nr:hypothetical protein Poli38472_000862 [Pythium oligandrum]|eukprot:TMW60820.1 hypothetical protein Poli38472_000862 [Pythium oligandrum]
MPPPEKGADSGGNAPPRDFIPKKPDNDGNAKRPTTKAPPDDQAITGSPGRLAPVLSTPGPFPRAHELVAIPVLKPYGHILTHQEKKKQRMPKRKADSWPGSILTDPDVLSLDDEGRFVLCKVCHVHYAVHGGKKPKPVIMNSSFRTRAWEVHKERTNSHRMQKKQDDRARSRHLDEERKESEPPMRPDRIERAPQSTPIVPTPPPPPQPPATRPIPGNRVEAQRFLPPREMSVSRTSAPMDSAYANAESPRRRVFHSEGHMAGRGWPQGQPQGQGENRRHVHARQPLPPPSVQPDRPVNDSEAMTSEQMDGLMRWRNMHDDISRALSSSNKRSLADQYSGSEVSMAEPEDFGGNNERVAKKLKSLNEEYDAKVLRRPEIYCDRRSETYKQYWGTLRDVYGPGNVPVNPTNPNPPPRPSASRTPAQAVRLAAVNAFGKESQEDATTPDDTGSSEDSAKPVVVHDQALVNAIDRLTGMVSRQLTERYTKETSLVLDSLTKLTDAVDTLRVDQNASMDRLINLQEQKLQIMQAMLERKLRKEIVENTTTSVEHTQEM